MAKNKKKSELKKARFMVKLSLGEAFGWAALLVFICGWFFILGIFVGRGLVPVPGHDEPFAKQLAETEQLLPAGPERPVEKKPAVSIAKKRTAKVEGESPKPEAALPPAVDPPEKVPVIARHVQAEAEEKADDTGDKIFTIQVAALREQEAANQLFEKLNKENYAPYIVNATLPDNVIWYRLRCGRFADHNEAAPVLEKLREEGYSPILVRR